MVEISGSYVEMERVGVNGGSGHGWGGGGGEGVGVGGGGELWGACRSWGVDGARENARSRLSSNFDTFLPLYTYRDW